MFLLLLLLFHVLLLLLLCCHCGGDGGGACLHCPQRRHRLLQWLLSSLWPLMMAMMYNDVQWCSMMFNGVDDSDGIPSCTVLDAHITSDCLLLFEVAKVHRKWTDMVFDGWNPALICDVKKPLICGHENYNKNWDTRPKVVQCFIKESSHHWYPFKLSSPKKRLWCVQTQRHSENQPNYCIWDSTLNLEYDHVKGLLSVLLEAIYIIDRLYHYIRLQTFDKTGMKLNQCIATVSSISTPFLRVIAPVQLLPRTRDINGVKLINRENMLCLYKNYSEHISQSVYI